jgi:hypothetical protein
VLFAVATLLEYNGRETVRGRGFVSGHENEKRETMCKRACSISCFLLLFLLLSCGTGAVPPGNTPQPTDTPLATATIQLAPTLEPTPYATATNTAEAATGGSLARATTVPIHEPTATPEPADLNLVAAESGGHVVSVTDELDCCPADKLIDGYKLDGGEWWTTEPPEFPQTVVLELAGSQSWVIDHVVLNAWTSEWRYAWVKDFDLYASADSPDLADMGWLGSFTYEHAGIDQEFSFDPVRARYVALVVTSHYGSAEGITLNEFEVYTAPPGTVAVEAVHPGGGGDLVAADNGGRIVDYSSQDSLGNWPVENLIDGQNDTSTGWSSDTTDDLQYVVFAFAGDQLHRVNRVILNPYSDRYEEDWIQDFELWGSDTSPDPDEMWGLGSFHLEQDGEDQEFTFDPVELRYIALVPTSNYGGSEYALNEFEVFEAGAPTKRGAVSLKRGIALPEGVAPLSVGVERPPESSPAPVTVQTDFAAQPMAASSTSPVDNIEYDITYHDLVPVIYHLYGTYFESLAAITVTNGNDIPVTVRVESDIPEYTEVAVDTVNLAPGETVILTQNPPLTPEALDLLYSQKVAALHVQIDYLKQGEKRLIYEGTQPLTIYSREDFPWNIPGYYNGTVFLATLVTPNDPSLDELMRVAADYTPSGIITFGYGDEYDSDHKVWDRMKAIYEAVAEYYNVIYVAVGSDFVPAEEEEHGFTLQRLKLPYEVLATHSGMCVELSALFASAFEKILLRPIIITVPGHVYVGVPISWDSTTYYFLEGTLVGRASFEEAVQVGNEEFMGEALPYIDADQLDPYFWLDVSEARQEGIWPIPWR